MRFSNPFQDPIAIRIKDEPGALARMAARFREPQIEIHTMRCLRNDSGWATVKLSTNNNEAARRLLADCMV